MPILNATAKMADLLAEPEIITVGLGIEDTTATDTATFLRDRTDGDSAVLFTRERAFNAIGLLIREGLWDIGNMPTLTDVTTDQTVDSEVALTGVTELTLAGTTFGVAIGDLEVLVSFPSKSTANGPLPFGKNSSGMHFIKAVITEVTNPDDAVAAEIVATVSLPADFGGRIAQVGSCQVTVKNKKRDMVSLPFSLTIA